MNFCNEVRQIKVSNRPNIKITNNKLKHREFDIVSNIINVPKSPTFNKTKKLKLINQTEFEMDQKFQVKK